MMVALAVILKHCHRHHHHNHHHYRHLHHYGVPLFDFYCFVNRTAFLAETQNCNNSLSRHRRHIYYDLLRPTASAYCFLPVFVLRFTCPLSDNKAAAILLPRPIACYIASYVIRVITVGKRKQHERLKPIVRLSPVSSLPIVGHVPSHPPIAVELA